MMFKGHTQASLSSPRSQGDHLSTEAREPSAEIPAGAAVGVDL